MSLMLCVSTADAIAVQLYNVNSNLTVGSQLGSWTGMGSTCVTGFASGGAAAAGIVPGNIYLVEVTAGTGWTASTAYSA
jgi:hypothetical protein